MVEAEKEHTPAEPPPPSEPASPPVEVDEAVKQFVAAAAQLQASVAWHEGRGAEHKAAAKTARDLLASHGVRAGRATSPVSHAGLPAPERVR